MNRHNKQIVSVIKRLKTGPYEFTLLILAFHKKFLPQLDKMLKLYYYLLIYSGCLKQLDSTG